jgi:hypothetical protein
MRKILAAVCMFGMVGFALADPIIYDNGGLAASPTGYSSQLFFGQPYGQSQVADNFVLTAPNVIVTDIHWWGVYWNPGPPGDLQAFNIYFYNDAGGVPTGGGMTNPEVTAIASYTIPFAAANETPAGPTNYFSYDAALSPPLTLNAGTPYWVAIQAVMAFPPQWGWATSNGTAGNAKQGFPYLNMPFWTQIVPTGGTGVEMAFYLTGIPEPASLLLLSLGGLLLRRR